MPCVCRDAGRSTRRRHSNTAMRWPRIGGNFIRQKNISYRGAAVSYRSLWVFCSLIFGAPLVRAEVPSPPGAVVLKAAHIFDAVSGKLAEHGVVVIEDGKITAIGADARIPAGERVIELG